METSGVLSELWVQHFQQGETKTLAELAGGVAGQAKGSTGKQNKGNKGLDLQWKQIFCRKAAKDPFPWESSKYAWQFL